MTHDRPSDVLATKALTLRRLAPHITTAKIDEGYIISRHNWDRRAAEIIGFLRSSYDAAAFIVRSSSRREDTWKTSGAGQFASVVVGANAAATTVKEAMDTVFQSYGDPSAADQVFVQKHISPVFASAVLTTRTGGTGAPYYVVSLDDVTGRTDAITSGTIMSGRTWYVHREVDISSRDDLPWHVKTFIATAVEVEQALSLDRLDLELVIDSDLAPHLLQARPLVLTPSLGLEVTDRGVSRAIRRSQRDLRRRISRRSGGLPAVYSNMADWNPAEMIGEKPRPLAYSIYRYILTDWTWARQRYDYGYRDLRGIALMTSILGSPYIDIRVSLTSFIPRSVDSCLADEVVAAQLRKLMEDLSAHDKLEFEIAVPSAAAAYGRQLEDLRTYGLSADAVGALRPGIEEITRGALMRFSCDEQALARITAARLEPGPPHDVLFDLLRLARQVRHDIALVFAHLARAAFVATSLLRSFADAEVIAEPAEFMRHLGTITHAIQDDGHRVFEGKLTFDEFTARYGHLRPGTYEITTPAYYEFPDTYLAPFVGPRTGPDPPESSKLPWTRRADRDVGRLLASIGLAVPAHGVAAFCRDAILGREAGKFELSRWLGALLAAIETAGGGVGLSREDVSFCTLRDFGSLQRGSLDVATLRRRIEARAVRFNTDRLAHVPGCFAGEEALSAFEVPDHVPTFVAGRRVIANLIVEPDPVAALDGVVLVQRADPGYDWLFGHRIRGLITAIGGANSHMAVRCAEMGVPAVIGVGEDVYRRLERAQLVELDPGARVLRRVT